MVECMSNKMHTFSVQYTQGFRCYNLTWSGMTSSWWKILAYSSKLKIDVAVCVTLLSQFVDFMTPLLVLLLLHKVELH